MTKATKRKRKKVIGKVEVAQAMIYYGGSFISHLGQALLRADASNTKKIRRAFHKYWKTYSDLAKLDLEAEQEGKQ